MPWDRRHLLALEGLTRDDLLDLATRARRRRDEGPADLLAGRIIANLFFENSTRTRSSFTIAAQRLGATTVEFAGSSSSVSKGETLTDTSLNIEAMGVDAIVVRCRAAGGPALIARHVKCPVINAGDGSHEHPTQGLLDMLTLLDHLGDLAGRTIGIVGDVGNSRVARSNLHALTTLGANVVLIGPPPLVPGTMTSITSGPGHVRIGHDLDAELPDLDAIMMLRVQFERGSGITRDYGTHFGLTVARAGRLPEHAPVLHPGPMNRGLEIDGAVADAPARSRILDQVANGVVMRMAVIEALLENLGSPHRTSGHVTH